MVNLKYVDSIAVLTLSRSKVNPLSSDMVASIYEVVKKIASNQESRALIIMSDQKHFCAGADLKERAGMTDEQTMAFIDQIGECFFDISALSIPTIALMNGAVLGGGLELALACDFRICSRESSLGFPEVGLGIIPGAGGTQRLPRLIGVSRSKEMIFSAAAIPADTALEYGLVDYVYSSDDLYSKGLDFARQFVAVSSDALGSAKAAIDSDLVLGLKRERECYRNILSSPDRARALKVFSSKK